MTRSNSLLTLTMITKLALQYADSLPRNGAPFEVSVILATPTCALTKCCDDFVADHLAPQIDDAWKSPREFDADSFLVVPPNVMGCIENFSVIEARSIAEYSIDCGDWCVRITMRVGVEA